MQEILDYLYKYSTTKQFKAPADTLLEIDEKEGQRNDGQHSQSFWYGYWQAVCDISSMYEEKMKR